MGKVTPLRPAAPPSQRSPARTALAEAIALHTAAAAELKRVEAAKRQFFSDVYWAAKEALEDATKALKAMKVNEGAILAAAYLGDHADADKLDAASRAAVDAAAAMEVAEKTAAGLEERERSAKQEFDATHLALERHHQRAVETDPAMAALISRWETTKREFATFSLVMAATGLYAPPGYHYNSQRIYPDLDHTEANTWRAAVETMRHDPDAPLPMAPAECAIADPKEAS